MARDITAQLREVPRLVPTAVADAADVPAARRHAIPGIADHVVVGLVAEAWMEIPIAETGWTVAALMVPHRGTAQIAELRIFPREDDAEFPGRLAGQWSASVLGSTATCPRGGITARLLRRVPLGVFAKATDSLVQKFYAKIGPARMARFGLEPPGPAGQTRRHVADLEVARVADAYAKAVRRKSRRALEEIQSEFPGYTVTRLRGVIAEARARGFLTKTKQGTSGGTLTTKGRAALRGRGRA